MTQITTARMQEAILAAILITYDSALIYESTEHLEIAYLEAQKNIRILDALREKRRSEIKFLENKGIQPSSKLWKDHLAKMNAIQAENTREEFDLNVEWNQLAEKICVILNARKKDDSLNHQEAALNNYLKKKYAARRKFAKNYIKKT